MLTALFSVLTSLFGFLWVMGSTVVLVKVGAVVCAFLLVLSLCGAFGGGRKTFPPPPSSGRCC